MEDGRWVTINGAHVFVKDGQSPMDAFIRNKGKSTDRTRKQLDEDLILVEEKIREAETQAEKEKWQRERDRIQDQMYEQDMKDWDSRLSKSGTFKLTTTTSNNDTNIRKFSEKIQGQSKESAIVFDDNGKEIIFKDGEKYNVTFRGQELQDIKGMNFTHNHPTTSEYDSTFSKQDLMFAYDNDLKSMSAINQNGTIITLTRDKSIITDNEHKPGFLAGDYERKKVEFAKGLSIDKLDEAAKNVDNWLKENAEKYGYRYKREQK